MDKYKKKVVGWLELPLAQAFIIGVIAVNVMALMLETVVALGGPYRNVFQTIELWSIVVFTAEYLTRMWSCTVIPGYSGPVAGRLRFVVSPFMLIDFIAIAPFYMPFLGVDMRVLRLVRIFRVFRLGKLIRYSKAIQTLIQVISDKRAELGTTLFLILITALFSAAIIYHFEHGAQPKVFSSIPAAMWFTLTTLSTVGYGDAYPITTIGKMITAFVAVLGIGLYALPAGILGAAYTGAMQKEKAVPRCPHCKKPLK